MHFSGINSQCKTGPWKRNHKHNDNAFVVNTGPSQKKVTHPEEKNAVNVSHASGRRFASVSGNAAGTAGHKSSLARESND